jgi:hypothetical protein
VKVKITTLISQETRNYDGAPSGLSRSLKALISLGFRDLSLRLHSPYDSGIPFGSPSSTSS